jgi:hypothetical protein
MVDNVECLIERVMFIDKYKEHEHGYSYIMDDCYYEDATSLIAGGMLGFCGCGDNDSALKYIKDALQLVADLREVRNKNLTWDDWRVRVNSVFSNEGAEYFMWYFLDNKELTEHGSSVPGWLTTKGEELLSDLNELINELER